MSVAKVISRRDVISLQVSTKLRPRLNLHATFDDPVQKMIVVIRAGEELPPHANSRELTQVILEGTADMIIYDEAGKETERFQVDRHTNFCYTLPPGTYHTKRVYSERIVFFEVMAGPYVPGDVVQLHS